MNEVYALLPYTRFSNLLRMALSSCHGMLVAPSTSSPLLSFPTFAVGATQVSDAGEANGTDPKPKPKPKPALGVRVRTATLPLTLTLTLTLNRKPKPALGVSVNSTDFSLAPTDPHRPTELIFSCHKKGVDPVFANQVVTDWIVAPDLPPSGL